MRLSLERTMFIKWIYVLAALVVCVECEQCLNTGSSVIPVACDYGCCEEEGIKKCCKQPFWTWAVIVGVVLAGIIGVMFISLVVCLACRCFKKTPVKPVRQTGQANTAGPTPSGSNGRPSSPDEDPKSRLPWSHREDPGLAKGHPPPYDFEHDFEPPPKYEDIVPQGKV